MRTSARIMSAAAILLCVLVFTAGVDQRIEDFSSTAYSRPGATTADWNTVDGELKLFPFALAEVGSVAAISVTGDGFDVTVDGGYAYYGSNIAGLRIIDVHDPANPVHITDFGPALPLRDIIVSGNRLVAVGVDRLSIVDISDPASPFEVGSLVFGGSVQDVDIEGDIAYVSDYNLGTHIVDISNPASPSIIATEPTPSYGVAVDGDVMYVTSYTAGIKVFEVSNPVSPTQIGAYQTPGGAYQRIELDGDHAYASATPHGMEVIDISDPTSPALDGTYSIAAFYGMVIEGDRAYLAGDADGLVIVDISDPTNPVLDDSITLPSEAVGLDVDGAFAYVTAQFDGLRVVSIMGDLDVPALQSTQPAGGRMRQGVIRGDNLFAASGGSLDIFDLGAADTPVLIASFPSGNSTWGVEVAGDYAFLADGTAGLRVVDVSDPTSPVLAGSVAVTDDAFGVALHGNVAFIMNDVDGMSIIDITDPTSPSLVGTFDTPGVASDMIIDGDIAYVIDQPGHVQVLDISNPASPSTIGATPTGFTVDAALDGRRLYVVDVFDPVRVYDVSSPSTPVLLASETVAEARRIEVVGSRAYVGTIHQLAILDISDPADPELVGSVVTGTVNEGIAMSGGYLHCGALTDEMLTYRVTQNAFDTVRDRGQQWLIATPPDSIWGVQLVATQTESIEWEITRDDATWLLAESDGSTTRFDPPSYTFAWRTTHAVVDPAVNPSCDEVVIKYVREWPQIESVTDVVNDQGRQVRVTWVQGGHDFVGDPSQTMEYSVYRLVDPAAVSSQPDPVESRDTPEANPPGWDFVTTVPADADASYSVVVPTLLDSTATSAGYSSFIVRARTAPGVYQDSPPDSGYSVDNIGPSAPSMFVVAYNVGSNLCSWNASEDPDLAFYRVYRDETPAFVPSPANLAVETEETSWLDTDDDAYKYFYKLTSVDDAGNESDPIGPEAVTDAGRDTAPSTVQLQQNVPNPFNPNTEIRFSISPDAAGPVTLTIYDVAGRRVRTIVDSPLEPGVYAFPWDGTNAQGAPVPSGVYLYRLHAGSHSIARKMVVLK